MAIAERQLSQEIVRVETRRVRKNNCQVKEKVNNCIPIILEHESIYHNKNYIIILILPSNDLYVALIKSISGIRGTIGGVTNENLTPLDIVKFAAAFGLWSKRKKARQSCHWAGCPSLRRNGKFSCDVYVAGLGIDVMDLGLSTTPTVEIAVPLGKSKRRNHYYRKP